MAQRGGAGTVLPPVVRGVFKDWVGERRKERKKGNIEYDCDVKVVENSLKSKC